MRKIKFLLATIMMLVGITAQAATRTVTWNNSDITGNSWDRSFTKDGITITAGMIDFQDINFMSGGTFTTTSGKFTKIEVSAGYVGCSGTGWSGSTTEKTWEGDASSSVSFSGDIMGMGEYDVTIVFTIEPDAVAVTGVTLNPSTAQTIDVDGTVSFTATVAPDNATDKTVKWSTTGGVTLYSDENCTAGNEIGADATSTLTVYAKGTAAGSATVTATSNADSTKSASCNVTVNDSQAQTEGLITTITATGKEEASYNPENVATVEFSYSSGGSSAYLASWGWWGYGWTATVNAAEGYTITKCVFYDDANRTATDSEAPFVVETTEEDKTPRINGTPIDGGNNQSKGIKKIEVYGYVTPTTNEGATGEYWATYYNGTESYTADANTTVYQAAVNAGKTAVVLTEVTGREIPAGKGVVLKSSASTITLTPATTTQTLTGNELLGVDAATAAPANAYCLSKETSGSARGVGFYTFDGIIPAHRAYLVVAGGPSNARGFLGFGGDDNTTGIALPEAVVIEGDGAIYDLSGRQVTGQPQKGIYVKNGKKIVIK